MIFRALIALAALVPCAALAAPKPATPAQPIKPPASAAEFASLPALGKLVEGGVEKDARFRTYLMSKRPTIQGPISIFIGELQIRTQDISPGAPRPVKVEKWKYAARCSGDANTIGVNAQRVAPPDKSQTYYSVYPGTAPDPIDRTWYNVWYAVCLDDFNKYPRKQEE
jgi:hypothetical protein